MTRKSSEPNSNIRMDIGAKASLDVSVKTEIPSQTTGRLIDALTDLIRPFSEARGLRADQIRLQREEILVEVTKLARRRIEIENGKIEPLPTKVLVPLLEKASLEEPSDSYMIDKWANLLASGALRRGIQPRLISVLSELTTSQATLLESLVLKTPRPNLSGLAPEFGAFDGLRHDLNDVTMRKICAHALKHSKTPLDELFKNIQALFTCRGVILAHVYLSNNIERPIESLSVKSEEAIDLSVLKSLDLVEATEVNLETEKYIVFIYYYQIAVLGLALLSACSPRANAVLNEIEKTMREVHIHSS